MIYLSVGLFSVLLVMALSIGRWRITTPVGYFAYMMSVYYFAKFLICSMFGLDFLEGYKGAEFALAYLTLSIYLLVALLTRHLTLDVVRQHIKPPKYSSNNLCISKSALVLAGLMPLLVLLGIRLIHGFWSFESPGQFRGILQSGGNAYFFILANFFSFALCVYLVDRIFISKSCPSFVSLISLPIVLFYAITCGFTSMIVILGTYAVYYWQVITRKRFEYLIVVLFPLLVAFGAVHLKYKNASRLDVEKTDLIYILADFLDDKEAQKSIMNRLDYIEMYNLGLNNLLEANPDYGVNMLSLFIQPIPRVLWPDKPLTFTAEMTRRYLPENFASGVTANFGGLNEFINAFGLLGIVIGGVFLGCVFSIAEVYYSAACINKHSAGFYVLVVMPYVGGCLTGGVNDYPIPFLIFSIILFKLFCKFKSDQGSRRKLAGL